MRKNEITIAKKTKKANCFDSSKGIPEFLTANVKYEGENSISCICIDGKDNTPVKRIVELGAIIAFEEDTKNITKTGWNCWVYETSYIENNLELIDGEYYARAVPLRAAIVSEELPEFTTGMKITAEDDGSFTFDPGWGDGTMLNAVPSKGVWIYYGTKKDGTPDVNYCQFGTKSSANYVIIGEDGSKTPLDALK